jgi:hypothetical protein
VKKLFIIGNGFDCYGHAMKTQYVDFKGYLEKKYPECQKDFNGILEGYQMPDGDIEYDMDKVVGSLIRTLDECTEPDWKNLESCLANDFLDNIRYENEWSFNYTLGDDVEDDIFHSVYQNEDLSNSIIGAYECLKELFCMWVHECLANIDFADIKRIFPRPLFGNGVFLNFNYTLTLEKLYNISSDRILHIHGNVYSDIKEILFGHGDDTPWGDDDAYMGISDAFSRLKIALRKNTDEAIYKHSAFFTQLSEVKKIYSYGFSFSDVDMVYIEQICQNLNPYEVKWCFNRFDWNNNKEYIEKIRNLGFKVRKSLLW